MWQLSISLIVRGERRDRYRSRAYRTRLALLCVVDVVLPVAKPPADNLQGSPRC